MFNVDSNSHVCETFKLNVICLTGKVGYLQGVPAKNKQPSDIIFNLLVTIK